MKTHAVVLTCTLSAALVTLFGCDDDEGSFDEPDATADASASQGDACTHTKFRDGCATNADCTNGQTCVDTGRVTSSETITCPDGGVSSSLDSVPVHACQAS